MFNRCAVNALLGRLGRMRKVKRDNRNEEKGHFRCPARGTDVITAAYRLVHGSLGFNGGATTPEKAGVQAARLQCRGNIMREVEYITCFYHPSPH